VHGERPPRGPAGDAREQDRHGRGVIDGGAKEQARVDPLFPGRDVREFVNSMEDVDEDVAD